MKLSNTNEFLKISTLEEVDDNYGGVKQEPKEELSLFGKLCLIQIDHKNKRTYQVKTRSNKELEKLRNKKLMISTKDRNYLIQEMIINRKLTIMKCYDCEDTKDDL